MSTHMPGFQLFFRFFALFVLVRLGTSNTRVKFSMPGGSLTTSYDNNMLGKLCIHMAVVQSEASTLALDWALLPSN